jgi:branched-subunit amino acid ABC-type transport system permease component
MSVTGLLLSSLLLIVAAAASLIYGWINVSEAPVIASIVCSAASAIFMAMGLHRSRPPRAKRRPPPAKKARARRSGRSASE